MNPRPHRTPALVAALVALLASAPSLPAQVRPPADSVEATLMRRLSALSADSMEGRRAGTPGAARARAWLIRELTAAGIRPLGASYEVPFTLRARGGAAAGADTLGVNIVARIPGTKGSGPVMVLSAHYDHVGVRNGEVFNGADDDASGCIAILTIAERLLRERPQHDVILAFFDGEESGLQGARAFVNAATVPLAGIALNVNLDMVARQDHNALWVAGTSHTPMLKALVDPVAGRSTVPIRFGHDTKDLKPGDDWTNSSDHGAFHGKAIPFLYLGVEDHADYHKPGDDADKVDPRFYRGVVDFAHALVIRLDAVLPAVHAARKPAP